MKKQGSGIGRATAQAFASSGATHLVLLGRHESSLAETAASISSSATTASVHAVDITQEDALQHVASSVAEWDVLILCAGYISKPSPISSADTAEWWQNFEVIKHPLGPVNKGFQ